MSADSRGRQLASAKKLELWKRIEGEGGFPLWLVWRDDGSISGDCHWFASEDAAREYFDLRAAILGVASGLRARDSGRSRSSE